jgi:hypothetical protein
MGSKNDKILEFLSGHPLISISGMERVLGVTHGTLRRDKIPKRHEDKVFELLLSYGLKSGNMGADDCEGIVYTFELDRQPFYIEDGLKKRMDLGNGVKFRIRRV